MDAINLKISEETLKIDNQKVRLLIQNQFGSKVTFPHSINSRKSLMFFATDFCNVKNLAKATRSTDTIKDCANKVLNYNFGLEDSFCDWTSAMLGRTL